MEYVIFKWNTFIRYLFGYSKYVDKFIFHYKQCNAIIYDNHHRCSNLTKKYYTFCDKHYQLFKQECISYHFTRNHNRKSDDFILALVEYIQRRKFVKKYLNNYTDDDHITWDQHLLNIFRRKYFIYRFNYIIERNKTNNSNTEEAYNIFIKRYGVSVL